MSLIDKILAGIFGPSDTRSLEEAEADYRAAKQRYDLAQSRGDRRGMGQALPVMNKALNHWLAVDSDCRRARA